MKRIVVTPAGREKYLEILLQNLKNRRDEFDRWDIWINTTNQSDIDYIKKISKENDFIKLKELTVPHKGSFSICSFFLDYVNPEEIYLRLDDDVIYVQKGSIKKIFDEREKDDYHFLLYGNIINNAIISHIQQRVGNISYEKGKAGYTCMDSIGWEDPYFAEFLHNYVIDKLEKNKGGDLKIQNWILYHFERVSINVISWRGDEFNKFNGLVGEDEEQWLSSDRPKEIGRPNKIIGDSLFVHYSFYTQREYLKNTNILDRYKKITFEEIK